MASDSATLSSTPTATTADASSVDIYGATGTSSPSNAFGDTYTSPDENMQATMDDTLARAESGTMGEVPAEEITDATYSDYEVRNAARNHVGVDDHSYLSSNVSTSTEGASADTATSTEGETTVDEHYNKLFADSKYGSVDNLKYS